MPEATKIAEVKDKVQPVLVEEVPQLKRVAIRFQPIRIHGKAELFGSAFPIFNAIYLGAVYKRIGVPGWAEAL
jgi:hypothetical protein